MGTHGSWIALLCSLLISGTASDLGRDFEWLSPVYTEFFQHPLPIPPDKPVKYSYTNSTSGKTINYYEVEVKPFQLQIYSNLGPANLVGYDGLSPGPTLRMEKGTEAVIRLVNSATLDASMHVHGSYTRAPFDGWAEDAIKSGQYKDYYYPNVQSARTLLYHDHVEHHTAENAYFGQMGFYIIHDSASEAGLPTGIYDVPLGISSKLYKQNGDLFFPPNDTISLYGDVIQVNGQPWPYLSVEPRKYRFRLVDMSISRAYKLYFQEDLNVGKELPFQIIASDGGFLSTPITSSDVEISSGERWEVIFDFAAFANGNITLRNHRGVQEHEDYAGTDQVMRFVVGDTVSDTLNNKPVSDNLSSLALLPESSSVDKNFRFERSDGLWKINGVTFSDVANRVLDKPPLGTIELWDLENATPASHPVHLHLVDFQIISRVGGKRPVLPYEQAAIKDVVLLGEGEKVRIKARFAPWDGVYMFHCHNLIHEDHDMMAVFNVTWLQEKGYDDVVSKGFVDPLEERWRARNVTEEEFTQSYIEGTVLPEFSESGAYDGYVDPMGT